MRNPHLKCYLLPIAKLPELADPDCFWQVLDRDGRLVELVKEDCQQVMRIIQDWFGSDGRIGLPSGSEKYGTNISPPVGTRLVTCMARHDARVLRSRMRKRQVTGEGICEAYGYNDELSKQIARNCISVMERQADVLDADDQLSLMVITQEKGLLSLSG